ncbi:MAG UNVERIFIED_CONTAM: hypothetical protein LVQ98_08840 [Rickettsiaceae bacterium]
MSEFFNTLYQLQRKYKVSTRAIYVLVIAAIISSGLHLLCNHWIKPN